MQRYVRKSGHKVFGFQFMHPLWDATHSHSIYNSCPCISIHASLMGCNLARHLPVFCPGPFQFMHPLWDATAKYSIHISIYTIFCICYILLHLFHNDIDVNFMFQFVIIGASLSVFLCILRIRTNFLEPHVYIIYFYAAGYTLCVNCNFIIFH